MNAMSQLLQAVFVPRNVGMLGMDGDNLQSPFFCRYAHLMICSRLNSGTLFFMDAW